MLDKHIIYKIEIRIIKIQVYNAIKCSAASS